MTEATQSLIVTLATLGATIISLIALYISIVSNRVLKRENNLQRILESFLTSSYTEYVGGNPNVYTGEIAATRYLSGVLISAEAHPLPIKSTLEACLTGMESFIKASKWQMKRESTRQELQTINLRFITPLVEILNPPALFLIPPGVLDYFTSLSNRCQNIKTFIEHY